MLTNLDIARSDNWPEVVQEFIKLYCIGCPYAEQELITEGAPGCYLQQPTDVWRDMEAGECSSRWVRDFDWSSWRKKGN